MKLTCGISVGGKPLTFAISQTPGGELCCCLQECCGLSIDGAVAFLHNLEQAASAPPVAAAPEPAPAPEPPAPAKRGRKPAAPAPEEPAPAPAAAAPKDDRQASMFSSGEKPKPAPKAESEAEPEAAATPAPSVPLADEQLLKRYSDCANIRSVVNRAAIELGDTATQEKINRVVLKLQKAGHPALQREDLMDKVKAQAVGLGIEE